MSPGAGSGPGSLAESIRRGDAAALDRLLRGPLVVRPDNLVERPWGGRRLLAFKGLQAGDGGARRFGEAFELSAHRSDPEASRHPSLVRLEDGSEIPLPELLELAAAQILGPGASGELPLLPKTLDVKELLSVQTHPPGHPELYLILEAEAGATLRLGFRRDVRPEELRARLRAGEREQRALRSLLRDDLDEGALDAVASRALRRGVPPGVAAAQLGGWLRPEAAPDAVAARLESLRQVCGEVLALLNEIPVRPGQVLYNAAGAPGLAGEDRMPSAEVHALGNPEGRGILLLEVRLPGPTLRAWDHGRFPLRPLDIDGSVRLMSCRRREPGSFDVTPGPERAGEALVRLVENPAFAVDLIRPAAGGSMVLLVPAAAAATLHATRGEVVLREPGGAIVSRLRRGESALLPACCGELAVEAGTAGAELVRVELVRRA